VLQARERVLTRLFVVFSLGFTFELRKELGVRHEKLPEELPPRR
jgi:hypothetical protein